MEKDLAAKRSAALAADLRRSVAPVAIRLKYAESPAAMKLPTPGQNGSDAYMKKNRNLRGAGEAFGLPFRAGSTSGAMKKWLAISWKDRCSGLPAQRQTQMAVSVSGDNDPGGGIVGVAPLPVPPPLRAALYGAAAPGSVWHAGADAYGATAAVAHGRLSD